MKLPGAASPAAVLQLKAKSTHQPCPGITLCPQLKRRGAAIEHDVCYMPI